METIIKIIVSQYFFNQFEMVIQNQIFILYQEEITLRKSRNTQVKF